MLRCTKSVQRAYIFFDLVWKERCQQTEALWDYLVFGTEMPGLVCGMKCSRVHHKQIRIVRLTIFGGTSVKVLNKLECLYVCCL